MRRVVLVPFCISQIPQQVHINSSPFQGPPNNERKKTLGQEERYNKLLHIMRGYQCDKAVNKNDTREVI